MKTGKKEAEKSGETKAASCGQGRQRSSVPHSDLRVLPAGGSCAPDHAASDLCAGISGGLGGKIIRLIVDDNSPAGHFVYRKAVGQKRGEREPVVPEERRKISGVVRMSAVVRIIVRHGTGKRPVHAAAAAGPLVDVESEDPLMAGAAVLGEAAYLGADDHAAAGLEKPHKARNGGITFAASDTGLRLRPAAQEREKMDPGMAAG